MRRQEQKLVGFVPFDGLNRLESIDESKDGIDQGKIAIGQETEDGVVGAHEFVTAHVHRGIGVRIHDGIIALKCLFMSNFQVIN